MWWRWYLLRIYYKPSAMWSLGRLDWPKGAASREIIEAVMKLPRLQVYIDENMMVCVIFCWAFAKHICFVMQNLITLHVDHYAGDVIHLLQGLWRYDPSERLTARAALRHPSTISPLNSTALGFLVEETYRKANTFGWRGC